MGAQHSFDLSLPAEGPSQVVVACFGATTIVLALLFPVKKHKFTCVARLIGEDAAWAGGSSA